MIRIFNLGAIHKGRPQNLTIFYPPPPRPQNLAFYRQNKHMRPHFPIPLPLVRTSFMDDPLGAVYNGRPVNGEGVVLKFRTFPDGGRGGL